MIEEKTIESFKPKLRPGKIIPKERQLIFETTEPCDQIELPIETIQYLGQFNGETSIREVMTNIYMNGGAIQFKNLFKSVMSLKERGFLENGSELDDVTWGSLQKQTHKFRIPILFKKTLKKSLKQKHAYPMIFYILSMALIVLSLLGFAKGFAVFSDLPTVTHSAFSFRLFLEIFVVSSIFLTLKNFFKGLFLILTTRRLFNVDIIFNGFALFLRVGTESSQMIIKTLFKVLLFVSSTFCYFSFAYAIIESNLLLVSTNVVWYVALCLFFLELDPFSGRELSSFFRTTSQNETLLRVEKYLGQSSLAHSMNLGEKLWSLKAHILFFIYSVTWLAFGTVVIGLVFNAVHDKFSNIADPSLENLLIYTISFAALAFAFLINLVKLLWIVENSGKPFIESSIDQIKKLRWRSLAKSQPREELRPILQDLPLFGEFSQGELDRLIDQSFLINVDTDTEIITKGKNDTQLYVLLEGTLSIYLDAEEKTSGHPPISYIHPTSVFGEWAALEGQPRGAYVFAHEHSTLLEVPGDVLKDIAQESTGISGMENFVKSIMVNQYFSSAPMFKNLSKHLIDLFTSRGKIETIPAGKMICKEGSVGTGFYLIIRGKVDVYIGKSKVSSVGQGGFFGEIAALTDIPSTATIATGSECTFFRISFAGLRELFCESIEMAMMIESIAEKRLVEDLYYKKEGEDIETTIKFG